MFGKELFIRFTVLVFRGRLSNFVCPSFPFRIEGRMWDVIVLIPDLCFSIYFLWINMRKIFACVSINSILNHSIHLFCLRVDV